MNCSLCEQTITPGLELVIDPLDDNGPLHCPYCLGGLFGNEADEGERRVSVARHTGRRRVREAFVDELIEQAHETHNARPRCPQCEHPLSKNDEILLRNMESFCCGRCHHDLAALAYRQEAYNEGRWLSVIAALADIRADEQCRDCTYAAAMAVACRRAFAWIPQSHGRPSELVASRLNNTKWSDPRCEWRSCFAVQQYRQQVAEGLMLL